MINRLCHGRPQLGTLGNSAELSQGDEVEPDPTQRCMELLKMAIEIVSFPIKNGGSFHSYLYVIWDCLPEGSTVRPMFLPLLQMGFLPSANMVKSFDKCCRMKYEHIHHGLLAPSWTVSGKKSWYPCSEM